MELAKTLIAKAIRMCGGNQAELARKMNVPPARITDWKTGTRVMSPEDAALMADIAHEDAVQAAIDQMIERNAGTEKGRRLIDVLGKAAAAGVVATLGFSYSVMPTSAMGDTTTAADDLTETHIVLLSWMRRLRSLLSKVVRARGLRGLPQWGRPRSKPRRSTPLQRPRSRDLRCRCLMVLARDHMA